MADSVNYQHFKTLVEAYERAHPEKNKNTALTAVGQIWKKMKVDFLAADELEEKVNGKNLSFKKKVKCFIFSQKLYRRKN